MSRSGHELVCLLPARNAAHDLSGYLRSVARCCDAVVALDDGSTDRTRSILARSPLVKVLLTNRRRVSYRGWDDRANRRRLLAAAAALRPAWILFLDADERLAPGDARALREFVHRDALPGCAYGFQHIRMWGTRRCEADYRWIYRLFAFEPGQALPRRRLHFNPIPTDIPRDAWVRTTIRIQHFGAASEARIRGRLAKYREADPRARYGHGQGGLDRPPSSPLVPWRARPRGHPVLAREP